MVVVRIFAARAQIDTTAMQTKDKHILTDGEVLDAVVNKSDEIVLYKYKLAPSFGGGAS